MSNETNFEQFSHLIRPISDQVDLLWKLNKKITNDRRIRDSYFKNIDKKDDKSKPQSILSLDTCFVVCDSLEETIDYQLGLIELTQPGIRKRDYFVDDYKSVELDDSADKNMFLKPGIHRVRINVYGYRGKSERSKIMYVQRYAIRYKIKFAGVASIGCFALQDPLLLQLPFDGYNGDNYEIAEVCAGDQGTCAFLYGWDSFNKVVDFDSYPASNYGNGNFMPYFAK